MTHVYDLRGVRLVFLPPQQIIAWIVILIKTRARPYSHVFHHLCSRTSSASLTATLRKVQKTAVKRRRLLGLICSLRQGRTGLAAARRLVHWGTLHVPIRSRRLWKHSCPMRGRTALRCAGPPAAAAGHRRGLIQRPHSPAARAVSFVCSGITRHPPTDRHSFSAHIMICTSLRRDTDVGSVCLPKGGLLPCRL